MELRPASTTPSSTSVPCSRLPWRVLFLVPIFRSRLTAKLSGLLPPEAVATIVAQASRLGNISLPAGLSPGLNDAASASLRAALAEALGLVIVLAGISGFIAAAVAALMVGPRIAAAAD